MRIPAALIAALVLAAPPLCAQTTIWTGRSGGYTFSWTSSDIRAFTPARRPAWSARTELSKGAPDARECSEYSARVGVLSVIGTILSYDLSMGWYCEGAAHPSGFREFRAVDVSRPGVEPTLTDWFPAEEVRRALLADDIVGRALGDAGVRTPPARLDELVKLLAGTSTGCEYSFSEDLLSRFAFHHLENGRVAVRLGLSHGCEVLRGRLTQIGILLPIPESLRGALASAATGRGEGFLMSRQRAVSKGRQTAMDLRPRRR
ncbi:MAG TPA: hypothetical protein VHG28_01300 [Longimicrobiaceae bacterium]|nr:hypothetical protein [Longimicrobiaceae bacterium]